jgi:hypothetical protein
MKKCDDIKGLILTDYIDSQCDKDLGLSVEDHLLDCSECRAFFKEVKDNVASPFQQARHLPVPAKLWGTIKQSIEHETQVSGPSVGFIAQLKGLFIFPRLVPIFASFLLVFLAGSVTLNTIQIQQAKDKEQGEYLVALLGSTSSSVQTENNDLDTPIEHYFL